MTVVARAVLGGRTGAPGVGWGTLLVVRADPDDHVGGQTTADVPTLDPAEERARLEGALDAARGELERLATSIAARAGDEIGAIFEAQAIFASDPGIVGPAFRAIEAGLPAQEAILRSTNDQAERLATVDDEYFRARAADVRDVGRRVAGLLSGTSRPDLWHPDGRPAIIVADDLDPSAVATMRPELVAGIALGAGAPTGHAAIVARGLGIPLVLGLGRSVADLADDLEGLVDGRDPRLGRLVIAPTADDLASLSTDPEPVVPGEQAPLGAGAAHVAISANVGSVLEAEAAIRAGADGIGLVRTELLFLGRTTPPSVAEQRNTYSRILAACGDRPVVFRTLDVGGDKPAAWQSERSEANPALGVRGVRLGLVRSELLDDQLTALLQAAAGGEIRVMLPMVSTVGEVRQVRARLDRISAGVAREGSWSTNNVLLGVMIEVPSAALVADGLAEVADFFSIGTNDLVQYTLAADRINPALADLATPLQPAVLRLIDRVVTAARARGRHVAVCGEAAADPELIPLLVGLGVDELSVVPALVGATRLQVVGLETATCRTLAEASLLATSVEEVRALTRETTSAAVGPLPSE
jgi:phosphoenolpyruvate-protein phosphotransferase